MEKQMKATVGLGVGNPGVEKKKDALRLSGMMPPTDSLGPRHSQGFGANPQSHSPDTLDPEPKAQAYAAYQQQLQHQHYMQMRLSCLGFRENSVAKLSGITV